MLLAPNHMPRYECPTQHRREAEIIGRRIASARRWRRRRRWLRLRAALFGRPRHAPVNSCKSCSTRPAFG